MEISIYKKEEKIQRKQREEKEIYDSRQMMNKRKK
jgi:hypothetical protein